MEKRIDRLDRSAGAATFIGAGIGVLTFLGVGLLPSLVYGGYAGLLLAGGIFGTPVTPSLWARGLVIFGMVLGVVGVASLFAVGGAAVGAAIGHAVSWAGARDRRKLAPQPADKNP